MSCLLPIPQSPNKPSNYTNASVNKMGKGPTNIYASGLCIKMKDHDAVLLLFKSID